MAVLDEGFANAIMKKVDEIGGNLMANIRIYNLAKELEISNKEILEILEKII